LGGSYPPHDRSLGRPKLSVEDVAFGIDLGEAVDVEWRLGLADVGDHDLMVWEATPDHDPAGVQECVDAFGGEPVAALTGGRRPRDRVEQADDADSSPGWASTCRRYGGRFPGSKSCTVAWGSAS
jgi:hypothetical protein